MHLTPKLDIAIRISANAHRNQSRKGSKVPYIVHPFAVMFIASQYTQDENTLIACLFHDIIEDVPDQYSAEQMTADFGDEVTDIVLGVTKKPGLGDWKETCQSYLQNLEQNAPQKSAVVAVADKIHNIMSIIEDYQQQGDKIWEIFAADKYSQLWWFKSTQEVATRIIPGNPILKLLSEKIAEIEAIINK